jgi:phosphate/sulfate permease
MPRTRVWLSGLGLGLLASAVLAMVMTFIDWRRNPGGIFRNEQGTDWGIVVETLFSWFIPTIPAAVILSVAVLFLVLPKK